MRGRVFEVFSSVQGEGLRVGERHLFVRLAGCNLNCRYCDTPARGGEPAVCRLRLPEGGEERLENPLEASLLARRLAAFPRQLRRMVCLTGGEPLLQAGFLRGLLGALGEAGVGGFYLETNGTLFREFAGVAAAVDVVAMDIKLPSAYGGEPLWEEHRRFLETVPEKTFVKVVLTRRTPREEFMQAVRLVAGVSREIPLVIQPVWPVETPASVLLDFQEVALRELEEVRVVVQQQQILGVP